jgi:hypothetical protein
MRILLLLATLGFGAVVFASDPPPIAKVKVSRSGNILLDGRPASLNDLDKRLSELVKSRGVVWYYRENPTGEPPPAAMKVLEKIVEHKLPVRLCKDFNDDSCKETAH